MHITVILNATSIVAEKWHLLKKTSPGAFPVNAVPYPQKPVPPHGHVLAQLLHFFGIFVGVPPFPFYGRRDESPLPGLFQLVPVLVEVMVHLTLSVDEVQHKPKAVSLKTHAQGNKKRAVL